MENLTQQQILAYINTHLFSYLQGWVLANEGSHTGPGDRAHSSEVIVDQLQRRGVVTQGITQHEHLLYGVLHTGAPQTLLLVLPAARCTPYLAACLAAIDAYQEVIGPLPVNIKWLLCLGEEAGGVDIAGIVAEQPVLLQADGCLWYTDEQGTEDVASFALGAKGLLCIELAARTASSTLHAMHAAVVPNAVWRLLWALNSLKNAQEEVLVEGFYDTVTPAGDDVIEALYTLPDNAEHLARQWGLQHLLLELHGFQLHYAHLLTPTCTINAITGGTLVEERVRGRMPEGIPAHARAQIDFHLVPEQQPQAIFAQLQDHLHRHGFQDIEARLLYASSPAHTPLADPFVQAVRRAATTTYGQAPHILPLTAGSYPIAPLRQQLTMPVALTMASTSLAHTSQHLAILLAELAHVRPK